MSYFDHHQLLLIQANDHFQSKTTRVEDIRPRHHRRSWRRRRGLIYLMVSWHSVSSRSAWLPFRTGTGSALAWPQRSWTSISAS
eukprot:800643-Pyramimonas_sp.AAC.1